MANTQVHYAWQRQLVEALVIFPRTEAPRHGYGHSEVATTVADGTWAALSATLGLRGSLKRSARSARAVQLFGRLAVLGTHTL